MPEGPSILIAKEQIRLFAGQLITGISGNAKAPIQDLVSQNITAVHSWGKVLLIETEHSVVRIHLLMFGSYSIDKRTKPDARLRLNIQTAIGDIFFYTCSVQIFPPEHLLEYDWESDVLDDSWNASKARKKLLEEPKAFVCDALLDQQIFSGVGNIIKNEVLYRIRVHPETKIENLPARLLTLLISEARKYSFDFLMWKRQYILKRHWLIHTKVICKRCNIKVEKKYCGVTERRTFYCPRCQILY